MGLIVQARVPDTRASCLTPGLGVRHLCVTYTILTRGSSYIQCFGILPNSDTVTKITK